MDADEREPWQPPVEDDHGRYILDADGNPVRCDDLLTWARWLESNFADRHVDQTLVGERIWVSTVFLGVDHNFSRLTGAPHQPILFETMSFWHGDHNPPTTHSYELDGVRREYTRKNPVADIPENQERYYTRAEAARGHKRHVAIAERLLQELDATHGAGFGTPKSPAETEK